ncbi:class I SAM-dependent DNA methyltransferase [Parabacteroides johnsonii]
MAKKLNLSYKDIEGSLKTLKVKSVQPSDVGYIILQAFGKSDADIRRYRERKGILASFSGLLIKGFFCFRAEETVRMTETLEALKHDPLVVKAAPKIIVVSDGKNVLAYDMREKDTYENPLNRMYCDFAFFYPLIGIERFHHVEENPADVKAAEKLAKLHDELRIYNEFSTVDDLHDLNIFIARLLFCFFAEDTNIFENNLFTSSIVCYTQEDGSDISNYLSSAFNIMDIRERNKDTLKIISQFPYVNGGLFSKQITIPHMGQKARKLLIECGELDWKNINPDIFGSMIQAVVNPEERANQGMHYTSVPNIMKVINPLFLDELREEYIRLQTEYAQALQHETEWRLGHDERTEKYKAAKEKVDRQSPLAKDSKRISDGCQKLLNRMGKMKFFDPACGSGNFLIITYKRLRYLEMDILKLQQQCDSNQGLLNGVLSSVISLSQFYGIELLDFPHEIAMLSLWLAEHQMNKVFQDSFGVNTNALPLKNITQIVCGNACRLDWNVVCPHTKEEEVFVFGNPPFDGKKEQSKKQKEDLQIVFNGIKGIGVLDYVSCWYMKALNYIKDYSIKASFVSTNSICQGEHVAVLWPILHKHGICLNFAYKSFEWENNARNNAAVHCIILGFSNKANSLKKKYIYSNSNGQFVRKNATQINSYLLDAPEVCMQKLGKSISQLTPMNYGSMPIDNGHLIIDDYDIDSILSESPADTKFIRTYIGGDELLNGNERKCLWIENESDYNSIKSTFIKNRIENCRKFRLESSRKETIALANQAYRFGEIRQPQKNYMALPKVSSERREYLPIALYDKHVIANGSSLIIPNQELSVFALLSSKIHMIWLKNVGGRLEVRYQYSAQLCYNTFPFPKITDSQREALGEAAEEVLITRAGHPEKTLAELYDPDKMPDDLREAHRVLDDLVDSCYPGYPFANDEARLECLFKLYEKMTSKK